MQITITKQVLEDIVAKAQPFLEKKDSSRVTSHLLLQVDSATLTVSATNHELSLKQSTSDIGLDSTNGIATVNGAMFLSIIKGLQNDIITLEYKNDNLHVKQKRSHYKLPTFSSESYPELTDIELLSTMDIDSLELTKALTKVTSSTASNNPKYELNGALLEVKEDKIIIAATDTRRLSIVGFESKNDKEMSLIIPKNGIIEMLKILPHDDVDVKFSGMVLALSNSEIEFTTKLINGKYPDYQRVVPAEAKASVTLNKIQLQEALKQMRSVAENVKILIENNSVTLTALSGNNIEATTIIAIENEPTQTIETCVRILYLADFLKQTDEDFRLIWNADNLPLILESDSFKTVVMPIVA